MKYAVFKVMTCLLFIAVSSLAAYLILAFLGMTFFLPPGAAFAWRVVTVMATIFWVIGIVSEWDKL